MIANLKFILSNTRHHKSFKGEAWTVGIRTSSVHIELVRKFIDLSAEQQKRILSKVVTMYTTLCSQRKRAWKTFGKALGSLASVTRTNSQLERCQQCFGDNFWNYKTD